MKATEANLLNFFKGPKQFIIPIYQRTYSWTLKQCEQLWEDIVRAASNENIKGHFIGSIVYIEKGLYQPSVIPQLLVIDGQQRLTTVSLLLCILGRKLREHGIESEIISPKKITNYFLLNSDEEGEKRNKLILTQTDKLTLSRLIEERELTEPVSKRVLDNFEFFEGQIKKNNIDLVALYNGICKLIIVDIALNREYDNPQLIFESLNSTGLRLSQADLIRNYVLMGQEITAQEEIYNEYWQQMEQRFGQTHYVTHFDRFMRDYLTVKTGRIPNIGQVYEEFKDYSHRSEVESIKNVVADICKFSKYFTLIALEQESDKDLKEIFDDINALKVDVAYPFLLEIYDDFKAGLLERSEFIEILRLIESYVFRRAICGIPTNSLNKTFATLSKELDKGHYLESFKAAMLLKDSYRRCPDDDEFIREMVIKDLYNFRNRNYWLRKLENYNRKERVDVEGYTIEHIMPQNENLSPEWRADLGDRFKELHKQYLHTLGNLTLTGYNSEYSYRPFVEKRDMMNADGQKVGFAGSPLHLNEGLGELEHWNEQEILKRAERLAKLAVKVWMNPALDAVALAKYAKPPAQEAGKTHSLTDHPHLTGELLELFQLFRKRVLNLDSSVREEILKFYIAYKTSTNFVDVVPKKDNLLLVLNMEFDEVVDPKGLCKNVTGVGKWGNGDVQVILDSADKLDYIMALVKQSFEKHMENGGN